jgi:hypothetical protein
MADSFLADTARQWEASTLEVEEAGVRRAVIRSAMVLGRGGGALQKFLAPFRLFVGGPVGSGDQWLAWIHRDDEVRAIIHLMECGDCAGPYNLVAPNPVTMRQFARALGRAMRRPALMRVPGFAVKLALGQMGEELVLGGQRAVPRRLQESGFEFRYPEIDDCLRSLV